MFRDELGYYIRLSIGSNCYILHILGYVSEIQNISFFIRIFYAKFNFKFILIMSRFKRVPKTSSNIFVSTCSHTYLPNSSASLHLKSFSSCCFFCVLIEISILNWKFCFSLKIIIFTPTNAPLFMI